MYSIYLISSEYENVTFYKIGWTKRDPSKRLKELSTGNSQNLQIQKIYVSKYGPRIEANLHRIFSNKRCNGEWFKLSEEDLDIFESLCKRENDIFEFLLKENDCIRNSKEFNKYL